MQLLVHVAQALAVEASTGVPDIAELAVAVEVSEQDRAEIRSGTPRLRITADHEFGAMLQLELEPVARASPGHVSGGASLRHHTLPASLARSFQHARAVRRRLTEANTLGHALQKLLETRATLRPRRVHQILSSIREQIEDDDRGGGLTHRGVDVRSALQVKATLQRLEVAGPVALQRHDLAVEDAPPAEAATESA